MQRMHGRMRRDLGWERARTSVSALGAAICIATRSRFGTSESASNPATGPPCKCNGNRRSISWAKCIGVGPSFAFTAPTVPLRRSTRLRVRIVDRVVHQSSRMHDLQLSWGVLIARENMGSCVPRFQLWVGQTERNTASPTKLTERTMQSSAQRCHLRAVIDVCDDRR